jgi:hypothetical protein
MEQFKSAIRPLVTLLFCLAFIYMAIAGSISKDAFIGIATLVIKYWFDERAEKSAIPILGEPLKPDAPAQ